jgi:hypothetical protein
VARIGGNSSSNLNSNSTKSTKAKESKVSITTMILGESGTGKSTSMRNLNPADVLLIQAVAKPLPFKATGWKPATKENPAGSIVVSDNSQTIIKMMQRTVKPIIILDDFQYTMSNEFMRRVNEKTSGSGAFDKFNEIAHSAWSILTESTKLDQHKRVYVICHTTTDDHGKTKAKTIGKLLDDKITIEGIVTIVLRTGVTNGSYYFRTRNDGADTTKTPLGMFDDEQIPNDLAAVDQSICDYYEINQPA